MLLFVVVRIGNRFFGRILRPTVWEFQFEESESREILLEVYVKQLPFPTLADATRNITTQAAMVREGKCECPK